MPAATCGVPGDSDDLVALGGLPATVAAKIKITVVWPLRPIYYNVVVVSSGKPTSVRFEPRVAERLAGFLATHPGMSTSSATNRLVDEGLRMAEHPGVTFRDGASGRRAGLAGGPDVWEVIRAVRSARAQEPTLDAAGIVALVSENTGVPGRLVRIAIDYWSSHPDEVDAEIDAADAAERAAVESWNRRRNLLTG